MSKDFNSVVTPTGTASGPTSGLTFTVTFGTSIFAKPGSVGGFTAAGTSTGRPGFCPYSTIHIIWSVNSTSCGTGPLSHSVRSGSDVGVYPPEIATCFEGVTRTVAGPVTIPTLAATTVPAVSCTSYSDPGSIRGTSRGSTVNFTVPNHVNDMPFGDNLVASHVIAHLSLTPSWATTV